MCIYSGPLVFSAWEKYCMFPHHEGNHVKYFWQVLHWSRVEGSKTLTGSIPSICQEIFSMERCFWFGLRFWPKSSFTTLFKLAVPDLFMRWMQWVCFTAKWFDLRWERDVVMIHSDVQSSALADDTKEFAHTHVQKKCKVFHLWIKCFLTVTRRSHTCEQRQEAT